MVNKITVLGSLNVDTTLKVERFPNPGETLAVIDKRVTAGGKGANQAVAAARSHAMVSFIGQIGTDSAGKKLLQTMADNNIDIRSVLVDETISTGSATILLDTSGQNEILVDGGANQTINYNDVKSEVFEKQDFLITQFETPHDVALNSFKDARAKGVRTILNPAPAKEISEELYKFTDLIIPNETESELLTGIKVIDEQSLRSNADKFHDLGVKNVIITVGSKGAFYSTANEFGFMPAFKVEAKDTTAAGDTFIGALASQLYPDYRNIRNAINYAQRASSIAVQRHGALSSIPTKEEILMEEEKR